MTVAVVDSGIDATHPDLAGRVAAQRTFVENDDGRDYKGHGTHVASTIAGTGAASAGRNSGVAPGVRLVDAKVCGAFGCPESSIIAGMEWAVAEQRAKVVNVSLDAADTPEVDPLEQAVQDLAAQHGALFVISAGNAGADGSVGSPGSADAALTVGAVDDDGALAGFSSRGPRVGDAALKPDITAPGVDIVAALSKDAVGGRPGEKYIAHSGTSMAAPHVAGAAAILAQRRPGWGPQELKAALMASALPNAATGVFGQGAGSAQTTFSAADDLRWNARFLEHDPADPEAEFAAYGSVALGLSYRSRCRYKETWNHAVFGPALPGGYDATRTGWVTRTSDVISAMVPMFGDGSGRAGASAGSGRVTLHRDDVPVGEVELTNEPAAFEVPAEPGRYRLGVVAERGAPFTLSTKVSSAWEFRSGRSAQEVVPLPLSSGDSSRLTVAAGGAKPPAPKTKLSTTLPGAIDVAPAAKRPADVGTDPSVLHFDVDLQALRADVSDWTSAVGHERVAIPDQAGAPRVEILLGRDAGALDAARKSPSRFDFRDGSRSSPDEEGPRVLTTISGRQATLQKVTAKYTPPGREKGRFNWVLRWQPVEGLHALVQVLDADQAQVVAAAKAIRLDRAQRCATPLKLAPLPAGAKQTECRTAIRRTPPAGRGVWVLSSIAVQQAGGGRVSLWAEDARRGRHPQDVAQFVANRTVGGYPAQWRRDDPAGLWVLNFGPATELFVTAPTEAEATRLVRGLKVAPDLARPATWPQPTGG